MASTPNIVFVFADEWRGCSTGFNGDPNCETPVLDMLAAESLNLTHAVSGCPVCCPYRASLMTGQYPLTHGVYINDVELNPNCNSIARVFHAHGYHTAYIGKWHLYGSPDGKYGRRQSYVPRDHQLGFDYWKAFECSHEYNHSGYFFNDDTTPRVWEGYDAEAQSRDAAEYIHAQAKAKSPFLLMLSWGPPHFPLQTAPERYRDRYAARTIHLRPNVPNEFRERAERDLRGYYAHMAALDACMETVLAAIASAGVERDTILVFTSDHGEMRYSQGLETKLFPWDESIRVPFLLRWPGLGARSRGALPVPIDAPDILPTLLGLCGMPLPETVEGRDWSAHLRGDSPLTGDEAAYLNMPAEFTELRTNGIKAYRGLRTARYTYVRTTAGPWLLYDNESDPYQMNNLIENPSYAELQAKLDIKLRGLMSARHDSFRESRFYLERDHLTHYQEVSAPLKRAWRDPWRPESAASR